MDLLFQYKVLRFEAIKDKIFIIIIIIFIFRPASKYDLKCRRWANSFYDLF